MPFTIKHILKCHIGKYREAASMLQLWKPLSHPFCTSRGGVTEYHRVYLFQPKSNNPTHVSSDWLAVWVNTFGTSHVYKPAQPF